MVAHQGHPCRLPSWSREPNASVSQAAQSSPAPRPYLRGAESRTPASRRRPSRVRRPVPTFVEQRAERQRLAGGPVESGAPSLPSWSREPNASASQVAQSSPAPRPYLRGAESRTPASRRWPSRVRRPVPTFVEQRAERQRLAGGPVESGAGPQSVPTLLHKHLLQVRVDVLRGGEEGEAPVSSAIVGPTVQP